MQFFVLHCLDKKKKLLSKSKCLYAAFIGMQKCFDSIYSNGLWYKLYNIGIDGKVLRIINSMYSSVKSCVRHCNQYSEYFDIAVGLRQGEIISPIMFNLFVEDLELTLQSDINSGIAIEDLCLIVLLFADNIVIIDENPDNLQKSLNNLSQYCDNWGLEVNIHKTKIVVFRKSGKLRKNEYWYYTNTQLEIMNDFNYLGCTFNFTGYFILNDQTLYGMGLKAMNV